MPESLSVWIIGPPCAGKSTLTRLLVGRLREHGRPSLSLDGTEIRSLFDNKLGYDPKSRRKQTERVKKLAQWVLRQDLVPVVAIIHPFEDDRARCRAEIPGYLEVYLKCAMDERIRRDGKKLYLPALRGEKRHVVGVDIPFDEPEHADLVIETDRLTAPQSLEALWRHLGPRLAGR